MLNTATPAALEPVGAALRAGDIEKAKGLAREALSAGIEHPMFLNLRALAHEDAGRFDEALADLRRAHLLAPKDFAILNACGLCLARLERLEEAIRCFDQALALKPDFGQVWFNRGGALERLGETAKAAVSYAKAAEIHPQNPHAWANLAFLAARRGDAAGAREHAGRALDIQPGHVTAILALAQSERDDPAAAEHRLRLLLDQSLGTSERGLALGVLGDVLDALDRPSEAFTAYAESNRLFRSEAAPRFEAPGRPTIPETLAWLLRWAADLEPARSPPPSGRNRSGEVGHVFLIGFPRSGTTLIESALANHPDIVSLEERDTLRAAVHAHLTDRRSLARLETVSGEALERLRADYWARVAAFGVAPAGKVFIDKNPFNTLKLPLIHKLFPAARIIFAVRDPRDVVFSCFRRRFNLNPSTYEYLDLTRAAANYASSMRLAEILRPKQRMAEHRLVYERLIEDFPGELRALCAFLGVDWREDLVDIAARGRRGDVASASSAQISRGLFSDGVGQWRRYRRELAPVLEIVRPWVERFGYPPD